jgi:RimJ/RimL family protein N-acetyltransferase
MLEGLLVDLVPYGKVFQAQDHTWWNNESMFWASMGERRLVTQAAVDAEHREWRESEEPDTGVAFGVQTKDGQPLGYMGLNWVDYWNRHAMLGAVIGEADYWGGGYGTDGLLLLVDYAFGWLDMRKVWLVTMSLNVRVLRQMQKVGFTVEARCSRAALADGKWYDEVFFSLLREEWPGREAMIAGLGLKTP